MLSVPLHLGPMPASVAALVRRLVAESPDRMSDRPGEPDVFCLTGGPGGGSYLDANGEAWHVWFAWNKGEEDVIARVEDGPKKVILISIAADRVSKLSEWLPKPPSDAKICKACSGTRRFPVPANMLWCYECSGLGWVAESMPIPDSEKPIARR